MDAVLHLNIYLFPMILLACILMQMQKNVIKTTDNRFFRILLMSSFIILGTELMIWVIAEVDFPQMEMVVSILSTVYLFLVPVVPMLWINYVYFHLNKAMLWKVSPVLNFLLVIPLVAYYVLMILTSVTKRIFQINDANEGLQGILYAAPFLLAIIYMILALCIIGKAVVTEEVMIKKRQNLILFFFVALPFFAVLVQMCWSELWITLPTTAVAQLLVYLQLQRQEIMQDALTGVNNRRSLDYYFKKVLDQKGKGEPFYLFLMDLDRFKEINDTYGHAVGDEALVKAASLLSQVFHSATGFVARFGGDEFCAIEVCQNEQEAEELVKRLEATIEETNANSKEPYQIAISVGYAFFWEEEGLSQNELITRADEMMYQNKRRRKSI